ncbi:MAG: hypothetical protein AB1690_02555 [Candidatus Zixiibacteriota bacterium]
MLDLGLEVYNAAMEALAGQSRFLSFSEKAYVAFCRHLWKIGKVRPGVTIFGVRPNIPLFVIIDHVPRLYAREELQWN